MYKRQVQSALKIDAMTSHWEFTYGEDRVKEIVDKAPFAFLAQNIRESEWKEEVFKGRKMFEKGGAKIAVIGQAFPRTPIANPAWMIPKWEYGCLLYTSVIRPISFVPSTNTKVGV